MKIRVDDDRQRMLVETAQEMIYEHGVQPGADNVLELLGSKALTPMWVSSQCFLILSASLSHFSAIQNAFSERLSRYGLDFHSMFVVDLLHEFELGVWKATFMHLLRILYAQGGDGIQTLNKRLVFVFSIIEEVNSLPRYRDVPTFGRDTIRKFVHNASGMKKLAARDFEDLLQVRYANHHLCLRY